MKEGKYLSELISLKDFSKKSLNLVNGPCGSGKTYCATNMLSKLSSSLNKVLYLIDKIGGRKQILLDKEKTRAFNPSLENVIKGKTIDFINNNKITVMTYAKMGAILRKNPFFLEFFEVVICDELQSLEEFITMGSEEETPHYTEIARKGLNNRINSGKYYTIALSATPNKIYKLFNTDVNSKFINKIPLYGEPREYEHREGPIKYNSITALITTLSKNTKGFIYVKRITDIEKIIELFKKQGKKAVGIWSIYNKDHPMTEEQLKVRDIVLNEQRIPEDVDVLIINKSYDTAINIKSKVNWVIIHDTDEDVRIQARYRIRGDIEYLYYYEPAIENRKFIIEEQWLDTPLTKEMKKELCDIIDLRNKDKRKTGWTTLKKGLNESGYSVKDIRKTVDGIKKSFSIITKVN